MKKKHKRMTAARARRRIGLTVITLWTVTAMGSLWILAGGTQEERVWVSRSDRSRQCAPKSGIPLEKARKEFEHAGMKVLDLKRENDGMPRAQVCGASTGYEHRALIWAADLAKAEKLGFKKRN